MNSVTRASHDITVQNVTKTAAEQRLEAQARSLEALTDDVIKAATWKGAGVGALAGCSLAVLSASNASQCVGGALLGGAVGAAIGNQKGKAQVAEQLTLVSRDDVAQSLSRASARMGSVRAGLRDVLAAQDAEAAMLKRDLASGAVSQETYDARLASMGETRRIVAEALMLTAKQAKAAKVQLEEVRGQGQDGLEWHVETVSTLEADAVSARTAISLL
ncbi:hypothetical protein ACS3SW_05420 [Roseobacteraceae bacterium S113]